MSRYFENLIAAAALSVPLFVGAEMAAGQNDAAISAEAKAQALDVAHELPEQAASLHRKAKDHEGHRTNIIEIVGIGEVLGLTMFLGMEEGQ